MSFLRDIMEIAKRYQPSVTQESPEESGQRPQPQPQSAQQRVEKPRPSPSIELAMDVARRLRRELDRAVIGLDQFKTALIACLLTQTDILVISPPGEAKTYTVACLAKAIEGCRFARRLGLPDLTRAAILGDPVIVERSADPELMRVYGIEGSGTMTKILYDILSGPVSANIFLMDEVFKAPSQVLVALYDIMDSREIHVGRRAIQLRDLWLVVGATNPAEIEQRLDTNDPAFDPLFDRFAVRIYIPKSSAATMADIVRRVYETRARPRDYAVRPVVTKAEVEAAMEAVAQYHQRNVPRATAILRRFLEAVEAAGLEKRVSPRKAVYLAMYLSGLDIAGVTSVYAKLEYLVQSVAATAEERQRLGEKLQERFSELRQISELEEAIKRVEKHLQDRNLGEARNALSEAYDVLRRIEDSLRASGSMELAKQEVEYFRRRLEAYSRTIERLERQMSALVGAIA